MAPHALKPLPKATLIAVYVTLLAALFRDTTALVTLTSIGSYQLGIFEPVLAAALVGIIGALRRRRPPLDMASLLVIVLITLTGLSLARGILADPLAALTAFRAPGTIAAILLLGLSLRGGGFDYRPVLRALRVAATMMALLALVRFVVGPQFLYLGDYQSTSEIFDGGRATNSAGALLIGAGLMIVVHDFMRAYRPGRLDVRAAALIAVMLGALVVSQQATALIASAAGLLACIALTKGRTQSLRLLCVAVIGAILAIMIFTVDIPALLPDWVVGDVAQRSHTHYWRQVVWNSAIADYQSWSPIDRLIGQPVGTPVALWTPLAGGSYIEFNVHSMYVGTLRRYGIIGLVAYSGLLILLLTKGVAHALGKQPFPPTPAVGAALALSVVVFGYSYELAFDQAFFLAIALIAGASQMKSGPVLVRLSRTANLKN
jgi:hypothetical protein